MQLDHAAIAARIPHSGRMCLLDRVLQWDAHTIRCSATSHRDMDNPLRDAGGLAMLAAIEYAAQAAGVHSALMHGARLNAVGVARSGVLAALKNVTATRAWLHDVAEDIVIEASLLHGDPAGGIFAFAVFADEERVLSGQFTLMYIDKVGEQPV